VHPEAEREGKRVFHKLSSVVKLLRIRNERLKSHRALLQADLLKERHESEALARASPFEQFMDADFFLFFRSELGPEHSPFTDGGGPLWRPWSCIYFSWRTPDLLVRTERKKVATQLLPALALRGVTAFRERDAKRASNVARFFSGSMHFQHEQL
jgi:hypothetical protein